jgi:hypothetical protein
MYFELAKESDSVNPRSAIRWPGSVAHFMMNCLSEHRPECSRPFERLQWRRR